MGFQEPSWETTFRHGAAATTIQPGTEPPFAGLATEVHVDLYCEQIRPDRLSQRPETPDQCDAPHDRRKPAMTAALVQKPAFRSRLARYKGAVHYERSC